MGWLRRPHRPLGPLGLPADALIEIEPIRRADGRLLKRYKIKAFGDGSPILTEVPMDQTFDIGEVKVQPMAQPAGLVFFQEYGYGPKT